MAKSSTRSVESSGQIQFDASPSHLILFLGHENGWVRHHARECLVVIGKPAVPELIKALQNTNEDIRWEAAKALSQIKDPRAAPALVKALSDKNVGVRWLAAEGLIILRGAAVTPLLLELIEHPDVIWLRQGAHHVLHGLTKKRIYSQQSAPVLEALEGLEPAVKVPFVAKNLLDTLAKQKTRKRQRLEK
jgi:hypothetical protein